MAFADDRTGRRLFRQLTGRRPEVEVSTLTDAVKETYGVNRLGNPDAKAAADDLGVSVGTVRRWLKGTQHPSEDNAARASGAIERAREQQRERMQDADYRAQQMPPHRAARFAKQGFQIQIGGDIQISNDRRIGGRNFGWFRVDGKTGDKITQAWLSGDDDALRDAIEQALMTHHLGGLDVQVHQLTSFGIKR